jgi:hypothetical protein
VGSKHAAAAGDGGGSAGTDALLAGVRDGLRQRRRPVAAPDADDDSGKPVIETTPRLEVGGGSVGGGRGVRAPLGSAASGASTVAAPSAVGMRTSGSAAAFTPAVGDCDSSTASSTSGGAGGSGGEGGGGGGGEEEVGGYCDYEAEDAASSGSDTSALTPFLDSLPSGTLTPSEMALPPPRVPPLALLTAPPTAPAAAAAHGRGEGITPGAPDDMLPIPPRERYEVELPLKLVTYTSVGVAALWLVPVLLARLGMPVSTLPNV